MEAKFPTKMEKFQPALPMRGVTVRKRARAVGGRISTRTPHAGSDRQSTL